MHKYFRHFFGAGADKAMMIHDKHYKTEKARRQGKNQKNKAQKRNWFTRVRVLFLRAGLLHSRTAGPGNSTAQPPCAQARGRRAALCAGGQTPRQAARRGARLCHAFPAPRPRPLCAKGARGPHTGHRPALPASPLCPSALPGQGPRPGSAKPRARPAGRARGETYLPFSGRGARLIFWLQGPQNPRRQVLR